MIIVVTLFVLGLVAGFLMLGRPSRWAREDKSAAAPALISVIIPARNEAQNIEKLLRSLQQQNPLPNEIIVVDDASTDGTGRIAQSLGAKVLSPPPLESGWTGKNWACHHGALAAHNEILFFVDADCVFETGGLARIVNHFESLNRQRAYALSVLPWHLTEKSYESFSIFFNLIMAAGSGGFGFLATPRLVGQSLIIKRKDYQRAGGHSGVRNEVLENFFMTSHLAQAQVACSVVSGRGILTLRMFPQGISQVVEGWTKAFARGAKYTPGLILTASIVWISALATNFLVLVIPSQLRNENLNLLLAMYFILAVQLWWLGRKVGRFAWWTAVLYPVPWLFYQQVFVRSIFSRQAKTWKGREL